jgi:hypothetical protein
MWQIISCISGVALLAVGILWLRGEMRRYRKHMGNALFEDVFDLLFGTGPRFIFPGFVIIFGVYLGVAALFGFSK